MKVTEDCRNITVTQTNLSKALKISVSRVNQLIQEGVVVIDDSLSNGSVKLFESVKNYYSNKAGGATSSDDDVDFNREHARLEKFKAAKEEIRLKTLQGELYEAKVVERVMSDIYVTLRTQLTGIPNKVASQLPEEIRASANALMTREIEQCLTEMSQYSPDMFMQEDLDEK